MFCILIDNDTRHHSGQNVLDTRGGAAIKFENQRKYIFFLERELKKALRDTLMRAALSGLLSTKAN